VDIISQNSLFAVRICFGRCNSLKGHRNKHRAASIAITIMHTVKAKSSVCLIKYVWQSGSMIVTNNIKLAKWWFRHYAASRKVAGSGPDEVNTFFQFT
jgi:hypothetical protein